MMVCANVGGLLLAGAAAKEKDAAIQMALGAGRMQIASPWLCESILLSLGGVHGSGTLSVVGLYGMLAYFVIQHRREIGVRMAIGATTFEIVYLVSRKTGTSVVGGLVARACLFAAPLDLYRQSSTPLTPFDRILAGQALILITLVGVASTLIPSLRGTS